MDHVPVIAVDLDGTINYKQNLPMRNRKKTFIISGLMRKLKRLGFTVIIYTSRNESRRKETISWLVDNSIIKDEAYDDIVFGKLKYDIIIDSCAYNPIESLKRYLKCDDYDAFGLNISTWNLIDKNINSEG